MNTHTVPVMQRTSRQLARSNSQHDGGGGAIILICLQAQRLRHPFEFKEEEKKQQNNSLSPFDREQARAQTKLKNTERK